MSRTLVIETASEACSLALFDEARTDAALLAHDHRILGRGHAEQVVPMIAALPDKGRADRILVSLGPGSFTGVRIGIAAARALGFAWGAEVMGYPTLALVAAMAQGEGASEVTACMAGGHGEWFVADFGAGLEPLSAMRSLVPEAARDRGTKSHIAGNRAQDLADLGGGAARPHTLLPDARHARLIPAKHLRADLAPIYGRAPDARPQGTGTA